MKRVVIAIGVALLAATWLPQTALAQAAPPGYPPSYQSPPGSAAPPSGPVPPAPPPGGLDGAKQHRLAEIQHHMAILQTEQACVQNAQDHAQLRACRPPRHDH